MASFLPSSRYRSGITTCITTQKLTCLAEETSHTQSATSPCPNLSRQPGSSCSPFLFLSQRPAGRAGSSRAERDEHWLHDKAPGFDGPRASDESRPRHNPITSDDPSAKLVITNLHYEVSEKDLAVRPTSMISNLPLTNTLTEPVRPVWHFRARPDYQGTIHSAQFLVITRQAFSQHENLRVSPQPPTSGSMTAAAARLEQLSSLIRRWERPWLQRRNWMGSSQRVHSFMHDLTCEQITYVTFCATGQELSIKFENTPIGPRGGAKPSGRAHSLLERVQKPSLAARLSEAVPTASSPRFVHDFTPSLVFSPHVSCAY